MRARSFQPRDGPEYQFELPYDALRLYFRGSPNITFDDIPPMRSDDSDKTYRAITRSQRPTYLMLNDVDPEAAQARDARPDTYERVHRSLPSAVVARKSTRRFDGYVLTLYRADVGAQVAVAAPDSAAGQKLARAYDPASGASVLITSSQSK